MLQKPTTHRMNRYRSLFFQIGLIMAFGFCLMAFEMKSSATMTDLDNGYKPSPPEPPTKNIVWDTTKKIEKRIIPPHPDLIIKPILTDPEVLPILEPKPKPIYISDDNIPKKIDPVITPQKDPPVAPKPIGLVPIPEFMPEFPGGEMELMKFLSKTKYCKMDKDNGIQGTVFVTFVVNEFGEATDIEVLRGVSNCLNKRAVDKIKSMPLWTPGKQGEHVVRVPMVVQFAFQLQ